MATVGAGRQKSRLRARPVSAFEKEYAMLSKVGSRITTALVGTGFVGGLLVGGAVSQRPTAPSVEPIKARPAAMVSGANPAVSGLANLSDAFASVAERVRPSVVYIEARGEAKVDRRLRLPPGMEQYFPQAPGGGQQRSAGSGFIISSDGAIITNAHVVDGADHVKVRLLDHREYEATVVGTDPNTDIAVVRVKASGLTPAPLGDSDAARVGEWVLAVGNPLGENLSFTVTSGIVSAKGRSLELPNRSERSIQDFIQTDAAINPGNSGGPLVNVAGEVIGVNAAIATETGYYSGYGFAIPINMARQVADQILRSGHVERAALGVKVRDATENDATYVGLDRVRGVVVEDVGEPDGPAARAGLRIGDVIVAIDGKPAEYVGQLQQAVAFRKPGETVAVEVARKGGSRATLRIRLQAVDRDRSLARTEPTSADDDTDRAPAAAQSIDALGLTVENLRADDAAELGLPSGVRGVAITGVDPNGPCAERVADPASGAPDVLVAIEGQAVRTAAEVRDQVKRQKPGAVVELRLYNPRLKAIRVERVRLGGR
jgi:serine protease Do